MNILILGATSDIAKAISHHYAAKNHSLFLAGRKLDELQKQASDLQIRYGIEAFSLPFDATHIQDHGHFYRDLPAQMDMVFCVFGYLGDQEEQEKNWAHASNVLMVNYVGACSILHHVAIDFEARKHGTIVGISSVAGERGRASNYYYGSAKAGFTAYLSGLRNRLHAANVQVLTVIPGYVQSKMTEGMDLPGPLTADPSELAKAVAKAIKRNRHTLYVKSIWRPIMWIIKRIPEGMFKRLSL